MYNDNYQNINQNYSNNQGYVPPIPNQNNRSDYPTAYEMRFEQEVPMNFSTDHNKTKNNAEYNKLSYKLIQIDNRLNRFSEYTLLLWVLLILTTFSMFGSIFTFSKENEYSRRDVDIENYEIFNFFMCIFLILGYGYGIQAFSKQSKDMNKHFEHILIGFCGINFIYLVIFIFIPVSFFAWCVTLFFLIITGMLYYQSQEITKLLHDKEVLKNQYDSLYI